MNVNFAVACLRLRVDVRNVNATSVADAAGTFLVSITVALSTPSSSDFILNSH